jgi:hypothetical protein
VSYDIVAGRKIHQFELNRSLMSVKKSTIPKAELEAERKKVFERAQNSRENRKEEWLAKIAHEQSKTVALLQEISSELQQANETLTAILRATQKSR